MYNQPVQEIPPHTSFSACANCGSTEGIKAFAFTTFMSADGKQSSQQTIHYCDNCAVHVASTLAFAFLGPGVNRVEIVRSVVLEEGSNEHHHER